MAGRHALDERTVNGSGVLAATVIHRLSPDGATVGVSGRVAVSGHAVGDVDVPLGEAEVLVQGDRPGVALVDVEHDLGEPARPLVPQPDQGERGAEPTALERRVDAEDVDLADRLVTVVVRRPCRLWLRARRCPSRLLLPVTR